MESGARWGEKKTKAEEGNLERKQERIVFLEPFEFLQRHVSFFGGPYLVWNLWIFDKNSKWAQSSCTSWQKRWHFRLLVLWPRLLKRWIARSTGYISIQWISIGETNCSINWIKIYPSDSAIHLLNNWCLVVYKNKIIVTLVTQGLPSSLLCRPKRVISLLA